MALPSERANSSPRANRAPWPFIVGSIRPTGAAEPAGSVEPAGSADGATAVPRWPAALEPPARPLTVARTASQSLVDGARVSVLLGLALLTIAGLLPVGHWPLLTATTLALGLVFGGVLARFGSRLWQPAVAARVGHIVDGLIVANLTLAAAPSGWAALLLPLAVAALAAGAIPEPRLALALVGWDLWLFVGAAVFGGLPVSDAATAGLLAGVVGVSALLARVRVPARPVLGADLAPDGMPRPRLIAMLSHDLRTPLTSVKGFAQLIQRDHALPEPPRRYAEVIVAESNRAIRTISDAVDLVQIQSGQVALLPSHVDIARVAANAISSLEPADADPADALIRLRVRGPVPLIRADAARLERVMVHLIATARRYGGDDATIRVEIAGDPRGVTVWVHSDNREIPTAKFAHLFNANRSNSTSNSNSTARESTPDGEMSGSGLGLYIAKFLVECHHGRLWFENLNGSGTIFAFWLPA